MFKKKKNGKVFYDEPLKGDEFLRITTNTSGRYILYHCYGLSENGITPLRMERIAEATTLNALKARARAITEPQTEPPKPKVFADYSHVRLPYKD